MMFKILNNLVAIPPSQHLSLNERPSRKHSQQLITKSNSIDSYKFSFFPNTIKDWNNLSEAEIKCQSLDQFKAAMHKNI